jgi:hypothetical protein
MLAPGIERPRRLSEARISVLYVAKTSDAEVAKVKRLKKQVRGTATFTLKRPREAEAFDEVELVLQKATLHLIEKHGMFLVATRARPTLFRTLEVWIITVTLRFDAGHEGYIGDLLYDGQQFTFVTEQSVIDERARKIAEDPEGQRKWNEYRASTLPRESVPVASSLLLFSQCPRCP